MLLSEASNCRRQLILPDVRSPLQFSDHYDGDGAVLFKQACALGLEGIVSKRAEPLQERTIQVLAQDKERGGEQAYPARDGLRQ
jgi:hypothetical protein